MKNSIASLVLCLIVIHPQLTAQEVEVNMGVDFYSTYVFRGIAFDGPSWQPSIELSTTGFTVGAWGSQGYNGFQEMDLYVGYQLGDLYVGLTDYYYPGSAWGSEDAHAFEVNLGYSIDELSVAVNYILNEGTVAGSASSDLYFELGYALDQTDVFVGAGDGWHSVTGDFALVNIGISTSKELVITEEFTVPLTGAAIWNPDTEQFYILVGFSF